jgi:hypothetical protein
LQNQLTVSSTIPVSYADGTLKLAWMIFHLPLTIHGLGTGHYMPLAFFLLANKHQTSHEDIFRHTVSEAEKLGLDVCPTIVYAEFEIAIHNAVQCVAKLKFKHVSI